MNITTDALTTWKHVANEWADMAINGLQHARNVADGMTMSTPTEIQANLEACYVHCREVQDAAHAEDRARAQLVDQQPRFDRMLRIAQNLQQRAKCTDEELLDSKMYALKRDLADAALALMLDIQLVQVRIVKHTLPVLPGGHVDTGSVEPTQRPWSLDLHGQPDSVL